MLFFPIFVLPDIDIWDFNSVLSSISILPSKLQKGPIITLDPNLTLFDKKLFDVKKNFDLKLYN